MSVEIRCDYRSRHGIAPIVSGIRVGTQCSPVNMYEVQVEFMEGDADGYKTHTIMFKNDGKATDHMIDFLNFLGRCVVAYPNGKGGCDDYTHVDEYSRFICDELDDHMVYDPEYTEVTSWHTHDGYTSSFKSARVFFYDSDGRKFYVNMI